MPDSSLPNYEGHSLSEAWLVCVDRKYFQCLSKNVSVKEKATIIAYVLVAVRKLAEH